MVHGFILLVTLFRLEKNSHLYLFYSYTQKQVREKKDKRTRLYKTLHRKLKIGQHKPHQHVGVQWKNKIHNYTIGS